MMIRKRQIVILPLILIIAACGTSKPTEISFSFSADSPEGRGLALFQGKGRCATCHSLAPDTVILGPSLAGIANRAATREAPLTAAEYLEESILQPDRIKAPGFESQQMDTTLAKLLTTDEISDVVAFLLTLK